MSVGRLVFAAILFLLGVLSAGCVYATHVRCTAGLEGSCTIDAHGIFTREAHVDLPWREIVDVRVSESTGGVKMRTSSALATIVTRSRGSIDPAGHQMLSVGAMSISDGVALAHALRPPEKGGTAPAAVDLWIGAERTGATMFGGIALLCWAWLVSVVRTGLRTRDR